MHSEDISSLAEEWQALISAQQAIITEEIEKVRPRIRKKERKKERDILFCNANYSASAV